MPFLALKKSPCALEPRSGRFSLSFDTQPDRFVTESLRDPLRHRLAVPYYSRVTRPRTTSGRISTRRSSRCLRWYTRLTLVVAFLAADVADGQGTARTNIGLAAVGAVGFHAGRDVVEQNADGYEAGVLIDLGWLGSPALRLQMDVALLRASLTERVIQEDSTFQGAIFDLTAAVSAVLLGGGSRGRVVPYLLGGLGVHALSSNFGNRVLDQRYNANPFGAHVAAGLRLWLSRAGRHAIAVEARRTIAENVTRSTVHFGLLVFYNDLIRPR